MKTSIKSTFQNSKTAETSANLSRLGDLIKAHAPHDGRFELGIPGTYALRISKANKQLQHVVAHASVCIVAQGTKSVMLDREVYEYDSSRLIIFSVDVPVATQIIKASYTEPYLALRVDLSPQKIAELALKVYPHGFPQVRDNRAVAVCPSNNDIRRAAIRFMEIMGRPEDTSLIGPLVLDEILIRLLQSPLGPRVAQIGITDSGVHGVSKAVAWIKSNFSQPIRNVELAKLANMSISTFHNHFKAVTLMSPLQFQKVLRLQEARKLMLSSMMDAGIASRQVGYLSASQFSREYGRFFGDAPTKDISKLREQMVGVGET